MPLTVELPPDLEAALRAEATRLGTTPQLLVLIGARQMVPPPPVTPPPTDARNMLEYLGDYVGCVAGDGEAFSQDTGRRFADDLAAGRKARP